MLFILKSLLCYTNHCFHNLYNVSFPLPNPRFLEHVCVCSSLYLPWSLKPLLIHIDFISSSAKVKEPNCVCRLLIAWHAGLSNSILPHALICRPETVVWTVLGSAECSGLTPLGDTQVEDPCGCVLPVTFQGRLCGCCREPVLALVFSLHRQTGFVLCFCTLRSRLPD